MRFPRPRDVEVADVFIADSREREEQRAKEFFASWAPEPERDPDPFLEAA